MLLFTNLPLLQKPLTQFPILYQEGVQNLLFSWRRILGWMLNGVLTAFIIFFSVTGAYEHQSFRRGGELVSRDILGTVMYTCVVWVVNCQMAVSVTYFTLIQHVSIWFGVAVWYVFLLGYGAVTPAISTVAYQVFIEALAPAPSFWIATIFIAISALVPCFAFSAIQMRFFPMYHNMIQWIRFDGRAEDPEYCHIVRQNSMRTTTVGVSARFINARSSFTGNLKAPDE